MDDYEISENIDKLNQVKQLSHEYELKIIIKNEGCSKSIQVFENVLATQTQTQTTKIQSLITTIFQSQGLISEKSKISIRNLQFTPNLADKTISITQNFKKAEQTINSNYGVALISQQLGKSGVIKIKFRICNFKSWIGLGLCKKEIVAKNNFFFVNYNNIGHGYYMISGNSYLWNHIDQKQNNQSIQNFQFATNDIISLIADLDKTTISWNHETKNQQYNMNLKMDDDLYFCVVLWRQGDSVEIIE